jgi:hypothetical protein
MGMEFSEFRNKLRLPSWQKADIEAELAAHLQEAVADLRAQGRGEAEAQAAALARFGDLDSLAESLQEIHINWKGGATVQRRLFKLVSIGVIVGFVLVLLILPNFREFFRLMSWQKDPWQVLTPKENALKPYSQDLFVQLYLAETDSFLKVREAISGNNPAAAEKQITKAIKRFDPVFALAPESPAPHQRLAMQIMRHVSLARLKNHRPEQSTRPYYERILKNLPEKRSPIEQLLMGKAIEQLQIATRLSGDNAAPDYLLAYAYFDDRQDANADEALRAAVNKPGWDLYDDELRHARWQTSQARKLNLIQEMAIYASLSPTRSHLRELTRLLSGLAAEKRATGAQTQAVLYLTAEIHLGGLMLRQADSTMDLRAATGNLSLIAGSFVDEREREAIRSLPISRQEQGKQITEVGEKNLTLYLISHGHGELAEQYRKDFSTARELLSKSRIMLESYVARMTDFWGSSWLGLAFLAYWQAMGSLGLLIIVGLISLSLRAWRDKGAVPLWRWWEWLGLMLLLVLPPIICAYIIAAASDKENPMPMFFVYAALLPLLIGAISFVVVLGLVIVGALLKRRRQNPEMRLGKFRACIASLRIILLPTAAALLLGTLLLSLTLQRDFQRFRTERQGIFQKGEVQYWGIGLPEK